jgi:hypothetical protein
MFKEIKVMEKLIDVAQAVCFGLLGITAVVGVCLGHTQHVVTAVLCGVMVWVSLAEVRRLSEP